MRLDIEDILKKHRGFIERSIIYWTWGKMYKEPQREEIFVMVLDRLQKQKEIRGQYGEASLRAFIWRIVRRTVVDYFRKSKRALEVIKVKVPKERGMKGDAKEDDGGDFLDKVSIVEEKGPDVRAGEVQKALDEINKAGIVIRHGKILLDKIEGLTRKQIAVKYGLRENQIRGMLQYGRRKLREDWRRLQARKKLIEKAKVKNFQKS